jgi:acetyl-CoA carboxylase biotin carboxylase subunit
MLAAAAAVAERVGYTNAGTIEFLVDATGAFYFLEMNTRLQVEHPVTELVTGIDLVAWQIRIARGERLTIDRARAAMPIGHAIECRVYAEDPDARFMPAPGLITHLRQPTGPGIRDDGGVLAGFTVPVHYDSLISKLAAWGADRGQAIARLRRAVDDYEIRGIRTTLPFFRWLLAQADFAAARFDTTTLDTELASRQGRPFVETPADVLRTAIVATALEARARDAQPAATAPAATPVSRWADAGRREGLR